MARKKAAPVKSRRMVQQRDSSGQFIGKVVFATLAASVVSLIGTFGLTDALQQEQWKVLFQVYQFMPPAIGVTSALFSGWVKARTGGQRSETFYAVIVAIVLSALLSGGIYLTVRGSL